MIQNFKSGERVPRFQKLVDYLNVLGEEAGLDAIIKILKMEKAPF